MGASSSSPPAQGVQGVDLASVEPRPQGWWAALALGGKLYGVPNNAEQMLVYDPATGVSAVDTRCVATGEGKWRAAVALGGKIYGMPDRADRLLIYDVASGKVGGCETKTVARGIYKWQSAVALGGKIYGIPHHADKILVYDPGTNKVSGVPVFGVATGQSKWVAAAVLGGKIYGVPCNASAILVYDPATGKASGIDIKHIVRGELKWLSAVTYDGKLFAVPCYAECILIYDPATGQVSTVDTTSVATGPGKWISALVLGGRVYGIPDHADSVLVYDVLTETAWGVDVTSVARGPYKWQSAVAMCGKIYAVPFNAETILVLDPATQEVSSLDTGSLASGPNKWGLSAVLAGRLCGLPYDARQLLLYEPERKTEVLDRSEHLPAGLSQEFLEDMTAAWLSEWIYCFDDISQPSPIAPFTVGGEAIRFTLHSVHEDPMQGTPARLATVTAAIPRHGKVVFLVFKGTQFLADWVVNSSVAPDFVPFHQAFGDSTTFVHHGAFHAVAQLRVHQWTALQEQLRSAEKEGIERLVVCGHSLGGQYAMAFLFQVFLDEQSKAWEDEPKLLKRIRGVSFGSPMCFGAKEGAEVRRDLAEYMHERSVIYVHDGDPAPRLWSEINIEECMRYLVDYVRSQLSAFSQRIVDYAAGPGGLAKRAEDLLHRPDIEVHLLRPAARYVHLSRIRFLAQEWRPWRPLQMEHIDAEHHQMYSAYMQALRASSDPSVVGSAFDEEGRDLVEHFRIGSH